MSTLGIILIICIAVWLVIECFSLCVLIASFALAFAWSAAVMLTRIVIAVVVAFARDVAGA